MIPVGTILKERKGTSVLSIAIVLLISQWGEWSTYGTRYIQLTDWAIQATAKIETNPPKIVLSWPDDPYATTYTVSRKARDERTWTLLKEYQEPISSYTDTGIQLGTGYEYKITKDSTGGMENYHYKGFGYIYAGGLLPLADNRGKVILLAEAAAAQALEPELLRFEFDLIADGWEVARATVKASDSVTAVKSQIQGIYSQDPGRTRALVLFGHVPVPYSGDITPDEHPPFHKGAWPADTYYADLDGTWTDSFVNDTGAERSWNHNVPGDGKFDQSEIPSDVELEVGRIDLSNLTCYANKTPSYSEIDLLRRYLEKDHQFRTDQFPIRQRGILFDAFGVTDPEPIASGAYRTFAPLLGNQYDKVEAGQYFDTVGSNWYLWSSTYTGGGGFTISYFDIYPQQTTADRFALQNMNVVFTTFCGSYFGDWDNESNFLRAALASSGGILTVAYSGKPHWMFHHMALGETIGFSTRITQQNQQGGTYPPYIVGAGQVHISLLGDPTLREHPIAPLSAVQGTRDGNGLNLSWQPASVPGLQGYLVYKASNRKGPYQKFVGQPIQNPQYQVPASSADGFFMVKAVVLSDTPAGSYYNSSQGAFYPDPFSTQPLQAFPVAIETPEDTPAQIQLAGGGGDGGPITVKVLTQPSKGTLSGSVPNLTYMPASDSAGVDSFNFEVSDSSGHTAVGRVDITIQARNDPPAAESFTAEAVSGQAVQFILRGSDTDGDPLTYVILAAPAHGDLSGTLPTVIYTPRPGFSGTDSFPYYVNDGSSQSPTAYVTVHVAEGNVLAPSAGSLDIQSDGQPTPVTLSGSDPNGGPLTFRITRFPAKGQLSGSAPNLTYTSANGASGIDSFTYVVNNGAMDSAEATVTISIVRVNHPPVANNLAFQAVQGVPKTLALTGIDSDGDAISYVIVTGPTKGTVVGVPPQLTYTAGPGTMGADSIVYYASDGVSTSAPATVAIQILSANQPPVAQNATLQVFENQSLAIMLQANDPEGDPLSLHVAAAPGHGQLAGTPPQLIYTPNPGYIGEDSFTFFADDGREQSALGVVKLQISGAGQAPEIKLIPSLAIHKNATASVPVTIADADTDSALLQLSYETSDVTLFPAGSVSFGGDGLQRSLALSPARDKVGSAVLKIRVSDGESTAEATLAVGVENSPPLPGIDQLLWAGEGDFTIPLAVLLANDSDPDGDPLRVVSVGATSSSGGQVSLLGDTLVYHPLTQSIPRDIINYTVSDTSDAMAIGALVIQRIAAPILVISRSLPGPGLSVRVSGPAGKAFLLEESRDGSAWSSSIDSSTDSAGVATIFLSDSDAHIKLYRARWR